MTTNIGTACLLSERPSLLEAKRHIRGHVSPEAVIRKMDASVLLVKPNTLSWGYNDRFWLEGHSLELLCEVKNIFRSQSVLGAISSFGVEHVSAVIRYNKGDDEINPHLIIYVPFEQSMQNFIASIEQVDTQTEFIE